LASANPFILCDNLVKIYKVIDHDVVALQGLDLVVEQGELMGIVGVSGSGKSTLLNILGGLDRSSAGRVWVDNKDLLQLTNLAMDHYRLNTVGFVWQQNSRNLVPFLTARKNIEMPMILVGEGIKNRRKRADELLESVGLTERRNNRLSELSGGEQQRVAIAIALANQPRLLLADEPTGEVDETTAQTIYDIFRNLTRQYRLTTLIVSHDPNLAHHVDRVIAIRDGKIASETIRQPGTNGNQDGVSSQNQDAGVQEFQELTVLDSVGRMQVPKNYLEKFNIGGRVLLEVTDEGILIRPVPEADQSWDADVLVKTLMQSKKKSRLQKLVGRWFGGMHGRHDI